MRSDPHLAVSSDAGVGLLDEGTRGTRLYEWSLAPQSLTRELANEGGEGHPNLESGLLNDWCLW